MTEKINNMPIDKTITGYFEEKEYFQDEISGALSGHFDEGSTNQNINVNDTFNDPTRVPGYTSSPRDFGGTAQDDFYI